MNECSSRTWAYDSIQSVRIVNRRGREHRFESRAAAQMCVTKNVLISEAVSKLLWLLLLLLQLLLLLVVE